MNITDNQLRRIIREFLDGEQPSDIEADEDAWAGGNNLELPLDHSEAAESESVTEFPEKLLDAEPVLNKEARIRNKQKYLRNLARRREILRK